MQATNAHQQQSATRYANVASNSRQTNQNQQQQHQRQTKLTFASSTITGNQIGLNGSQKQTIENQNQNFQGQYQNQNQNQNQNHGQQTNQSQTNQKLKREFSFANIDKSTLSEQWKVLIGKSRELLEVSDNQRSLVMIIVCCALLLDNMLYMVIVPIIPDYLRSIGAWSTYAAGDAKFVHRNVSGELQWIRVGGQLVYENEDSAIGFLFASKAIVQLLINPFSGALADRIGYEIPMLIGLVVMFASTMVFACGQTYSVLLFARSLQGFGSAFADTSGLAMLADRFTEQAERQKALGIALAFISFGSLVAPPFGAILYDAAGKEVPFILLSLVCLLDGALLWLVAPVGTFRPLVPSIWRGPDSSSINVCKPVVVSADQVGQPTRPPLPHQHQQQLKLQTTATTDKSQQQQQQQQQQNKSQLNRQKSISRRLSIAMASEGGVPPTGEPVHVLLRDPSIACCAGALVMANVSLAFIEPTISIWMKNTMPDIEEWQLGMVWLPAFVPHVVGVYATVWLAERHPRHQWLIAAIGLTCEGVACLILPLCSSFYTLFIPISIICFGIALIDTAILPTLGFLVDTRFVSVYGSVYAIADISYSLSYAIGPFLAGNIVESIGFGALNVLISLSTLAYVPLLASLRSIRDYQPFEEPQLVASGTCKRSGDSSVSLSSLNNSSVLPSSSSSSSSSVVSIDAQQVDTNQQLAGGQNMSSFKYTTS